MKVVVKLVNNQYGYGPPHIGFRGRNYGRGRGRGRGRIQSLSRNQQRRLRSRNESSIHQHRYKKNHKQPANAGYNRPQPDGRKKHGDFQSSQNVKMDINERINQLNNFKQDVTNINNYNNNNGNKIYHNNNNNRNYYRRYN